MRTVATFDSSVMISQKLNPSRQEQQKLKIGSNKMVEVVEILFMSCFFDKDNSRLVSRQVTDYFCKQFDKQICLRKMENQGGLWHWRIPQLVVGGSLLAFAAIFLIGGFNEEATRQAIRLSAKIAAVLFCMAFAASAVHGLLRNSFSFWWKMNRKFFGISFAMVHLLHLGFLLLLQQCFHPVFTMAKTSSLFAGGMAYLFAVAMLATSFPVFANRLTAKQWKLLHTIGGWWIWAIFMRSYTKRALTEAEYIPWAILLVAVLLLRLVAWWRERGRS
jgi:sulfoxide reductase heme-binding subunit YedZ